MKVSRLLLVVVTALVGCLGCGKKGSDLPTVPVTGKITWKGEPVVDATVSFASNVPDAKPANGKTDAQGNYSLQTYLSGTSQTDGALPGDYIVMVTKFDSGNPQKPTAEEAAKQATETQRALENVVKTGQPTGMQGAPTLVTPAKYQTKESPLKATVKKGEKNEFNFTLED